MQVYKAYFKVIQRNIPNIALYVVIFLLITIMVTHFGETKISQNIDQARINIAFINEDKGSALADGLGDYLRQNANIIDLPDNTDSLQDALFFNKIKYVVRIPAGFSQSFLHGANNEKIEKTSVEKSTSSVYLDSLINRYLNTAALYARNLPGRNDAQLIALVNDNVKQHSTVQFKSYPPTADDAVIKYYIYLVYGMLFAIFLGITSIMLVFNDADIRKRNLGSPMKSTSMSIQLMLGNLTFALAVWIIMVGLSLIFSGRAAFNLNNLLLYANSLCLTFVCLSLSLLCGNLMNNRVAQSAIANVVSLGLCFLSGVFVPQNLLGTTVNYIASFTPTFWYVKAVNDIGKLVVVNASNIIPIIHSMLVQLGFVAALLAVAMAITKQKIRA